MDLVPVAVKSRSLYHRFGPMSPLERVLLVRCNWQTGRQTGTRFVSWGGV